MRKGRGLRQIPRPLARDMFSDRRHPLSKCSDEQRQKVAEYGRCAACAKTAPFVEIDPAHLSAKGYRGGCNSALCCIPLCRGCHSMLDDPRVRFDLLRELEPGRWIEEIQHALEPQHYNRDLVALLERLTGDRVVFQSQAERELTR